MGTEEVIGMGWDISVGVVVLPDMRCWVEGLIRWARYYVCMVV
jgi:hypothetical protein